MGCQVGRLPRLGRPAHQVVQLLLQQEAGDGDGQELGDALRARVRAVGGAEGVVHVDGGRGCQLLGKLRVVRLLIRVEAHVLQQQHAALGRGGDGSGHLGADAVVHVQNRHLEQLLQALEHRRQAVLVLRATLGPSLAKRGREGERQAASRDGERGARAFG